MSRKNRESNSVLEQNAGEAAVKTQAGPAAEPAGEQLAALVNSVPESKSAKFVRLANRRVNQALKHIGYVRNLANRQNYEYTPEQAAAVVQAIQAAAREVQMAYSGQTEIKKMFSL